MKNKLIAGLVLSMLAPIVANAAAINWTSQSYSIWAQADVDVDTAPQVDLSASSLAGLPLVGNASASTANGSANVDIAIRNLSNSSTSAFELTTNIATSYSGGTNSSTQYANALSTATLANSFIAQTTNLYVTYDYSSLINMSASTRSLSYQGLDEGIYLRDFTNTRLNQDFKLINNNFESNQTSSAGNQYLLAGNSTHSFSGLILGHTYTIVADLTPDMFSSGTITDNSTNSALRVSFSDSPVTAVPEPETYAMLLTGLAFLGFSVRRKQQA